MALIKEILVDQLQDLLHAESQLTQALPKMVDAAHHPKLKEAFEKHLLQTQAQVERLRRVFELLGEKPEPKPCKAMMGLISEGEETIQEGRELEPLAADLSLIAAAQRVEHYEISAYGTARTLARQLGVGSLQGQIDVRIRQRALQPPHPLFQTLQLVNLFWFLHTNPYSTTALAIFTHPFLHRPTAHDAILSPNMLIRQVSFLQLPHHCRLERFTIPDPIVLSYSFCHTR